MGCNHALLAGGARAVCGLTGGIALGNLAVQQDHEAAHADSSDGRRRAARLYARALRVLRGALRCARAQPQPHPRHRPCPRLSPTRRNRRGMWIGILSLAGCACACPEQA